MFIGLWPKQKTEVPDADLKKLAKVFDTPDNPPSDERPLREARRRGGHCAYLRTWRGGQLGEGELFPWSTSFGAAGFLREGEEVRARHRIHNFTFGGFYDLCYVGFFDSGDKWIHASSQC
jgi:hypothetical protein